MDAIVTDRGICLNPWREDLIESVGKAGLPIYDISKLKAEAESLTGVPKPIEFNREKAAAYVEYRDGTLIDTVWALK